MRDAGFDALDRALTPEHRERFEDPGRDRRPGDRHAQRLVDVAGLRSEALDHDAEAGLERRRVERLDLAQDLERARTSATATPSRSITFAQAFGSSTGGSNRKRISGQSSVSVCAFSCAISHAAVSRARSAAASRCPLRSSSAAAAST